MRIDMGVSALLAVLLCLFKGAQGLTDHNLAHSNNHSPPVHVGNSYDSTGKPYDISQVKWVTACVCFHLHVFVWTPKIC